MAKAKERMQHSHEDQRLTLSSSGPPSAAAHVER